MNEDFLIHGGKVRHWVHPCPCGYFQSDQKPCTCAPAVVTKYQKRISGPLLDRIDIHIEVPRVDYEKLSADRVGQSSGAIRARAQAARNIQTKRYWSNRNSNIELSNIVCNSDLRVVMIVAETIKRINSADPQKMAEALKDTKFQGTTGVITFERKEGPVWNQWMGHQLFVKKLTQFKQKGEDAEVV